MSTPAPGYRYRALVTSVYDGDTFRADVDLGFYTWIRGERFRLARIDAPEVRGDTREAGLASRDRLRQLIDGSEVVLTTEKEGKYGRYIATVYLRDGTCVNDLLVAEGLAVYREY